MATDPVSFILAKKRIDAGIGTLDDELIVLLASDELVQAAAASIDVLCGLCGAVLGQTAESGAGLALFEAHLPVCPKWTEGGAP
jgi:hypothetical protein